MMDQSDCMSDQCSREKFTDSSKSNWKLKNGHTDAFDWVKAFIVEKQSVGVKILLIKSERLRQSFESGWY